MGVNYSGLIFVQRFKHPTIAGKDYLTRLTVAFGPGPFKDALTTFVEDKDVSFELDVTDAEHWTIRLSSNEDPHEFEFSAAAVRSNKVFTPQGLKNVAFLIKFLLEGDDADPYECFPTFAKWCDDLAT